MKVKITYEVHKPGLGAQIKEVRLQKGLSVSKASVLAGISRKHWTNIEGELTAITLPTLQKIEDALGCRLMKNLEINLGSTDNG